jgi:site-specific DNA recombinase
MRTALYTRISQDATGERAGVTRQLEDCEALAEQLGWEIVARYDDNDVSAFNGKTRPGFENMLNAMRRNEFGAVLCWHPDRLYRSLKDLERLIDIADERGVQLRTVNGGDLDLATSTGKMLARILGSVARQEVEHKGERQRRANEQRRAAGKWVRTGLRKFGYDRDGEPQEPEASALRQAADDVLTGKSLRGIAMDWNKRGFTTTRGNAFTSIQLRRTLINPLYAALTTHKDRVVGPGQWKPIIDEDTHRGLVAYLSDPTRRPMVSFERRHMGSGVYLCGICGERLAACYPGGPGGTQRPMTYACRSGFHLARVGKPLDDYVTLVVLTFLHNNDFQPEAGQPIDVGGLHTRRAALQARLDELAAMFAAGDIDGSQLRRGTTELRTQLAAIDSELAELARRNPVSDLLAGEDALVKRWVALSPDMKGKVVSELFTVTVLPTPRGVKGVRIDRATGKRHINPEYVRIERKTGQ